MPSTAAHPERPTGERADPAERAVRLRWWQHRAVRVIAGTVAVLALFAPWFFPQDPLWRVRLPGSMFVEVTRDNVDVYVGLLLMPFMRKVSYRKRDILIIVLVPFYGQFVVGKIVYRLLFLPRRDWLPRLDELPGVVRIPRGRGDYLLLPTFSAAEDLRTRWCINPDHRHPYDSWLTAQHVGCAGSGSAPHGSPAARPRPDPEPA